MMIAEISCHIEFADAASAEELLTYLRGKGGRARRFANTVEVTRPVTEAGAPIAGGPVTLDYSAEMSPALRDAVVTQLKKYRTTLAAQMLKGSSGFLETHDCYHDEGKACDKASQQRYEWGEQP